MVDDPGTTADDGLFPSAKVIGGYDFVGESWPNTARCSPDPDPIGAPDATTFGGHGTHVADIIGGKRGVAPGAKFYAVKACSAPATSCSGIALLPGMDFALDPNGDGRISDHVDIINMSLGSPYGQPFDDDLSAAVDNAATRRCAHGGLRRQQRRQAVHHRFAGCCDVGAERRADRGAVGHAAAHDAARAGHR